MATNPQQPPGSVRQDEILVGHRDLGKLPLLGQEEVLKVVGATVVRSTHKIGQPCASCGRVMLQTADFYAVCVCCGLPICSEAQCRVFCAEETCRHAVCARCRRKIGDSDDGTPQYLCLPHYENWERERLVIGIVVVLGAAILAAVLFFWMR